MIKLARNRSILYTVFALGAVLALPAASLAAPKTMHRRAVSPPSQSDTPAPSPQNAGEAFNVVSVELVGITTDEHGKIDTLVVRKGGDLNSYKGCGIALANVPHVVEALNEKRRFGLRVENGCIRRISVGNE